MSSATAETFVPTRLLRVLAWLSFVAETVIVLTGGLVRLTGSGLGCSEWPLCTPESLVPTPEQGIHGIIEFGNRTMTGVVGILAILVLLVLLFRLGGRKLMSTVVPYALAGVVALVAGGALERVVTGAFVAGASILTLICIAATIHVTKAAPQRRDLVLLASLVLVGVVAQALVGGITVLTDLNPFIVGFHYTASILLASLTAIFLARMNHPNTRDELVPRGYRWLFSATGAALLVTIFFGVLTTASGPHSGDANVIRTGFDATIVAHVHSWPGYTLAVLLIATLTISWLRGYPDRRWLAAVTVLVIAQIIIGVAQARLGLPIPLVAAHMVLASLSASAFTVAAVRDRQPLS